MLGDSLVAHRLWCSPVPPSPHPLKHVQAEQHFGTCLWLHRRGWEQSLPSPVPWRSCQPESHRSPAMHAQRLLPVHVHLHVSQPSSWPASPFHMLPPEGATARVQWQGHGHCGFVRHEGTGLARPSRAMGDHVREVSQHAGS